MKDCRKTYCDSGGFLVGTRHLIPDDLHVYFKKDDSKIIGCNRIFCSKCRQFLRNWPGYCMAKGPWAFTKADRNR